MKTEVLGAREFFCPKEFSPQWRVRNTTALHEMPRADGPSHRPGEGAAARPSDEASDKQGGKCG